MFNVGGKNRIDVGVDGVSDRLVGTLCCGGVSKDKHSRSHQDGVESIECV